MSDFATTGLVAMGLAGVACSVAGLLAERVSGRADDFAGLFYALSIVAWLGYVLLWWWFL